MKLSVSSNRMIVYILRHHISHSSLFFSSADIWVSFSQSGLATITNETITSLLSNFRSVLLCAAVSCHFRMKSLQPSSTPFTSTFITFSTQVESSHPTMLSIFSSYHHHHQGVDSSRGYPILRMVSLPPLNRIMLIAKNFSCLLYTLSIVNSYNKKEVSHDCNVIVFCEILLFLTLRATIDKRAINTLLSYS